MELRVIELSLESSEKLVVGPTPPSSGVALRCAERWYNSLNATFASSREIPHFPTPFWWFELVTYEGTNCPSSQLPPDGTKPDRSGLTATADARGSACPTVVSAHPPGSRHRYETGPSPTPSMNRWGGERGARIE